MAIPPDSTLRIVFPFPYALSFGMFEINEQTGTITVLYANYVQHLDQYDGIQHVYDWDNYKSPRSYPSVNL